MAMISIFSESLVIPITGYVCDRFKRWNHYILMGTWTANLALSMVLYTLFLGKWTTSQTVVIAINIAQSLIRMQYNNSLFKVTKLYIDYDTTFTDCILDTPRNNDQCTLRLFAFSLRIESDRCTFRKGTFSEIPTFRNLEFRCFALLILQFLSLFVSTPKVTTSRWPISRRLEFGVVLCSSSFSA